ncbi:glycosyltransferase [Geomonas agri]|uniref:glycosyltransferase n=1 Tax=Geomonas agri TaxID=2873702 RepID=UPI001CD44A83|nr:glycosyltransferase [Geomonas agri]
MTSPPEQGHSQPAVTVLMPVRNAERYLAEAIDSVLSQSFTDFELLVLDDASSDTSLDLLRGYSDARIRVVRNDVRLGVAGALNRGAQLARGRYIARMDADDVSLPRRLERQVEYLESHPEVEVLGTWVELMGADGTDLGAWQADRETVTWDDIRGRLPVCNCLAHPSVMMRRELLLRHPYHEKVPYAQDYELWLRLAALGCRMEKLDQVLLRYRVHQESVTSTSNRQEADFKNVRIKALCLAQWCAGRLPSGSFIRTLIQELLRDSSRLLSARVKGVVREALVRAGMLCGNMLPGTRSRLYFFFPFFHVGGAERVHAEIVKLASGDNPRIVITNRSRNAAFKDEFARAGNLWDLSRLLELLPLQAFLRGYLAAVINKSDAALVFGCNTPFFYTLLPYLRPDVRVVDLIHAFGGGIEEVSLPYCDRIDRRIVIDYRTLEDMRRLYAARGLSEDLMDRIDVVENGVAIPATKPERTATERLQVLYVGRGSEEKRVHLVGRIARLCHMQGVPADFTLVGALTDAVAAADQAYCRFAGELPDPEAVAAAYRASDILLLTSEREGFPMVVMEAMANGVVPATTDVGGISHHLRDGENGFILGDCRDEDGLVSRFAAIVARLHQDRRLLHRLSDAAYAHAVANFSGKGFDSYYGKLFDSLPTMGDDR